jgi:hypothetical protein
VPFEAEGQPVISNVPYMPVNILPAIHWHMDPQLVVSAWSITSSNVTMEGTEELRAGGMGTEML